MRERMIAFGTPLLITVVLHGQEAPRPDWPRINVIPSEANATVDVRTLPDDNLDELIASMRKAVNDPTVSVECTGATDMAFVRGKGVQCYGIGPAIDQEDAPKGFGAHSDQERILENELHRFVRFNWDVVNGLAGVK